MDINKKSIKYGHLYGHLFYFEYNLRKKIDKQIKIKPKTGLAYLISLFDKNKSEIKDVNEIFPYKKKEDLCLFEDLKEIKEFRNKLFHFNIDEIEAFLKKNC